MKTLGLFIENLINALIASLNRFKFLPRNKRLDCRWMARRYLYFETPPRN